MDDQQGDEEETGGGGPLVHQKDAQSSMDGQKNKRGGVANNGSQNGTERKRAGKGMLNRNGGKKVGKGKTENEIYGWNQRTSWMWKDGRCAEIC